MASDHHTLVRSHRTGQCGDHVGRDADETLLLHGQAHLPSLAALQAIRKLQSATPRLGHIRALEARQDLPCRRVADRLHRNGGQIQFRRIIAHHAVRREHTGRPGVTRIRERVQRATLDAKVVRPTSTVGPHLALGESRVTRIGVDDQPGCAHLLREPRLVAAEALAVTRDHDLALHVHAEFLQLREVFARGVVGVHHRRRHVAVAAVGVPAIRQVGVRRGRILEQVALVDGQRHHAASRRRRSSGRRGGLGSIIHHLQRRADGSAQQAAEAFHARGQVHGFEGLLDALDLPHIPHGAGHMRLHRDQVVVAAKFSGAGEVHQRLRVRGCRKHLNRWHLLRGLQPQQRTQRQRTDAGCQD